VKAPIRGCGAVSSVYCRVGCPVVGRSFVGLLRV